MKWITAWLNSHFENMKCHIYYPYLAPLFQSHLAEQQNDTLKVYMGFIHDKYEPLPTLDISTPIISSTCEKHWKVYIVLGSWFRPFCFYGHIGIVLRHQCSSELRKVLNCMEAMTGILTCGLLHIHRICGYK